ncbi:DUF3102 domain-containing protein [Shimia sp. R11_0]|uniref:DUF3102 domain-containing protein n=1 Tax=Shimia sp. R11_0 TaxID=2821096 RepID=UPI001ADD061C|nr:DUF3102 domain-containing protein [Shimia sp. R11_0]MBO9479263.1 DUF3102 domain-containing protein [Shimia sp. R11_0]
MNNTAAAFETTQDFPSRAHNVALTETARLAVSVNSKHREVQRLGRTAKEIAAEIGEELIMLKQKLAHGEFTPWVKTECAFSERSAQDYMKIAKAKTQRAAGFNRCDSIREVLALGKTPKEPPQQTRPATLDDLRKVERLRALRDDPAASEGERENAKAKLEEIEKEIGKVEPEAPRGGKARPSVVRSKANKITDKLTAHLNPSPSGRYALTNALIAAFGDDEMRLDNLLYELTEGKRP